MYVGYSKVPVKYDTQASLSWTLYNLPLSIPSLCLAITPLLPVIMGIVARTAQAARTMPRIGVSIHYTNLIKTSIP